MAISEGASQSSQPRKPHASVFQLTPWFIVALLVRLSEPSKAQTYASDWQAPPLLDKVWAQPEVAQQAWRQNVL